MIKYIWIFSFALLAKGCASPAHIPKAKEFRYHVKGLFMEASLVDGSEVSGEMIALESGTLELILLTQYGSTIRRLTQGEVQSADIVVSLTGNNPKAPGILTSILMPATLSHGGFLIFTLPLNFAVGYPLTRDAARGTYRVRYPSNLTWRKLAKFTRFPQGMPEGVDSSQIR